MAMRYVSSWRNFSPGLGATPALINPAAPTLASLANHRCTTCPQKETNANAVFAGVTSTHVSSFHTTGNSLPFAAPACGGGCSHFAPPLTQPVYYPAVEMSKPEPIVCQSQGCTSCGGGACGRQNDAAANAAVPGAAAAPVPQQPTDAKSKKNAKSSECNVCSSDIVATLGKNGKANLKTMSLLLLISSSVCLGLVIGNIVIAVLNFVSVSTGWAPCTSDLSIASSFRPLPGSIAKGVFWAITPIQILSCIFVFFVGFYTSDVCRYSYKGVNNMLNLYAVSVGFFIPMIGSTAILDLLMTLSCIKGATSAEIAKIGAPSIILFISMIQLVLVALLTSIVSKLRKCLKAKKANTSTVFNPATGAYNCNCPNCVQPK